MAAKFAGTQAHRTRVWDRKAESYAIILEALHIMHETYLRWLKDEELRRETDEETDQSRRDEYRAALQRLKNTIAREAWLLPDQVQQQISAMERALDLRHDNWYERVDNGCAEIKTAITALMRLARTDQLNHS